MTTLEELQNEENILARLNSIEARLLQLEQGNVEADSLDQIAPDSGELGELSGQLKAMGVLNSVMLSGGNQMVVGGIIIVSKAAGMLAADVLETDTTVDFGMEMTPGDWIRILAHDANGEAAAEWILVGSLVEETIYNVTRDVDGSGANAWNSGTAFAVVGQAGDCRIELVAGSSATVRLVRQGSEWDSFVVETEMSTEEGAIIAGGGSVRLSSAGIELINAIINGSIVKNDGGSWDITHTAQVGANQNKMKFGLTPNALNNDSEAIWELEDLDAVSPNLLTTNAGFEIGNTSGWTATVTSGSFAVSAAGSESYEGTYHGRSVGNKVNTAVGKLETATANRATVAAETQYKVSFAAKHYLRSGSAMQVYVDFYNAGGTLLSSVLVYSPTSAAVVPWTLIDTVVTSPASASKAGIRAQISLAHYQAYIGIDAAYIGAVPSKVGMKLTPEGVVIGAGGTPISGIAPGVYNYSSTSITNVSAKTDVSAATYLRVGNQCFVRGEILVRATATGLVEVDITLPFESNFSATKDCVGSIGRQDNAVATGVVSCDTDTKKARLKYVAGSTETSGQRRFAFWFFYEIK